MNIVVAPDSWKDCLPSVLVAEAMVKGIKATDAVANIVVKPMADGGQGTVEAMVRATGGRFVFHEVTGPLGQPVSARFGVLGDEKTAVIEMAAAAGLELVAKADRNPLRTTTRGVGELLLAAAGLGVDRIILGIGGSATNDGGAGMLATLGYRLLDAHGDEIEPSGGGLASLDRIDSSGRNRTLDGLIVDVACDVANPLLGPTGATQVFGPQKGAVQENIDLLERNLTRFASVVARDLDRDVAVISGAGAAGGLGAGLLAGTNATLKRGIDIVIDAVDLRSALRDADLCLTGEGSLDDQTAFGKTAVGVARVCRSLGRPCVVVAGTLRSPFNVFHDEGVTACFSAMQRPVDLETAIRSAPEWIAATTEQVVRLFNVKSGLSAPSSS